MTNLGSAISDIIEWLAEAFKLAVSLVKGGATQDATLLLADVQMVVSTYLNVINRFLPKKPVGPIPSGFFRQVGWFFKNITWLQPLHALLSGVNPFEEAKAIARAVAVKWGFADEVYGE
jgi:hypothetical protein